MTTCGKALGVGVGEAVGNGVGDAIGEGVGEGVGVLPPITTETGLLCTPSVVTISVHVPAPRNSAGTSTWISSSPGSRPRATVSTATVFPFSVTDRLLALDTPVAKIDSLNSPFEGSNGPRINVSEFRMIASPRPSAVMVNTPGALVAMMASAFDDKPSAFVTRNSAGPFCSPSGTTNTTSPGDT